MTAFILELDDPFATDPERVGPKAANLAGLTQADLPTPGGFALTAAAYRYQLRHLSIEDLLRQFADYPLAVSHRASSSHWWGLAGALWCSAPWPAS